jgi:hypothetical protein
MSQEKPKTAKFERVGECLYRSRSKGTYYAVVRHQGKLVWKSLKTNDRAYAKRKLADFKTKLGRTDVKAGKMTLESLCEKYLGSLSQSPRRVDVHDGNSVIGLSQITVNSDAGLGVRGLGFGQVNQ